MLIVGKDSIWNTIREAWNEGPRGSYHRRCYQEYTDKNEVAKAGQNFHISEQNVSQEPTKASPPKRVCRSHVSALDLNKCAICQKEKIKTKRAKTREPLTLNISEFGSMSSNTAAQIRNDTRLLLHINDQNTIAMEIKYHRSCYKEYVRQRALKRLEDQHCMEEDTDGEGYSKAFQKLKTIIEDNTLKNSKAIPMSELVERYTTFLFNEGIAVTTYRSSKLKTRLVRCFGEKISFRQPISRNQSEIVYSSLVDVGDVVETIFKNSTIQCKEDEGKDLESSYYTTHEYKDESYQVLVDVKSTMTWPPSPDDLDGGSMVPALVYNMMAWILSPQSEYSEERVSEISPDVHRLIVSLSQDLIHCVRRGRMKTPKHVVLPMTVKGTTGSVELITILNQFGHSLSYSNGRTRNISSRLSDCKTTKWCYYSGCLLSQRAWCVLLGYLILFYLRKIVKWRGTYSYTRVHRL